MPSWMKVTLTIIVVLALALWVAQSQQAWTIAEVIDDLEDRARQEPARPQGLQLDDSLPSPVRGYLDHALPPDRRGLVLARYEQEGIVRRDGTDDDWMTFTASQVMSPRTMEFLWTAQVSIAPLLHVQVRDSFIGGRGEGEVFLLSAIPVASAGGTMEMNSGSLHRFLAEAVWCPSALLPSPHLTWTPVDDARAVATLTHGSITVSLEFRFNAQHEVTGIYTPARWGSFDGTYKQVAWEGMFRDYSRRQGVLVPTEGEVGWYVDGHWQSVWRGTIVSASMEFR